VAEITETARNAVAQIAELAAQSTDDDVGLQQNNDNTRHHHAAAADDEEEEEETGTVSAPDGSIQPVQTFVTIPHGQSLTNLPYYMFICQLVARGTCSIARLLLSKNVCPSHAGIVSKRKKISSHFFLSFVVHHYGFLIPHMVAKF